MKQLTLSIFIGILVVLSATAQKKQKGKTEEVKPAATEQPAQTQVPTSTQPQTSTQPANPLGEHYARKYAIATRWNDLDVAKDALYDLIAEYPGSDSLIFSLAYSYYESQKYPSTVLICQDLLARNPKSLQVLELSASGYESLNINERALQNYESIFLLTSSSTALYKMSFLQFQLKKFSESLTNVDILLTKPDVDSLKVVYNDAAGKSKEYAMKVALLNLKGLIYKEQADKVNAKKYFDQALALAPDFVLAKQNLAALK